jgi:hypothetical protein
MSASNQQQINEEAAAAMHRAENPQSEEYTVEKTEEERQRDEAAAEAMRRADVAYTNEDER